MVTLYIPPSYSAGFARFRLFIYPRGSEAKPGGVSLSPRRRVQRGPVRPDETRPGSSRSSGQRTALRTGASWPRPIVRFFSLKARLNSAA